MYLSFYWGVRNASAFWYHLQMQVPLSFGDRVGANLEVKFSGLIVLYPHLQAFSQVGKI